MEISSINESDEDFNLSLEDEFRSIDRLIEQANEFLNDYNTPPASSTILTDHTPDVTIEDLSSVTDTIVNISESIRDIPFLTPRHHQSQVNFRSNEQDDDVICVDVQNPTVIDYIDLCSPAMERTKKRNSKVGSYNSKPLRTETEESQESVADEPQNKRAKELTCRICFESLFDRVTMSTTCGHVFCKICIDQVLKIQKKCPLCKHPVRRNQLFRIYL